MPANGKKLVIGGQEILPGERKVIDIPVAPTYTHDNLSISALVPSCSSAPPSTAMRSTVWRLSAACSRIRTSSVSAVP